MDPKIETETEREERYKEMWRQRPTTAEVRQLMNLSRSSSFDEGAPEATKTATKKFKTDEVASTPAKKFKTAEVASTPTRKFRKSVRGLVEGPHLTTPKFKKLKSGWCMIDHEWNIRGGYSYIVVMR